MTHLPTPILAGLAALAGVLIREVMAVTSRRNSEAPSFDYYWSLPKNRWNLLLNALCATGLMIAYPDVIRALKDYGLLQEDYPILTGLGIGLFAAFIIRWLITMFDQRFGASKKIREQQKDA